MTTFQPDMINRWENGELFMGPDICCDGLESRIADLTGRGVERLLPVQGGYTNACRRIVRFRDGNTAFAKCATDRRTSAWLYSEILVYRQLSGDFMADVLAYDEEEPPLLILEDLTGNAWPPPWTASRVDRVLDSLATIHGSQASVPEYQDIFTHRGWHEVASHPEAFLSIRVASESWLTKCLPILLEAHDRVEPEGNALVHLDVRSDNICFRDDRAVLIDWNNACSGNPDLDIAFWLPGLRHEGGPPPRDILADAGHLASYVTGYFASRAGLPDLPHTPLVRKLQRAHLITGLEWTIQELGLPQPDIMVG